MASSVSIVNSALTKLGQERIASLSDDTKPAREMNALYEQRRDYLMRAYTWSFTVTRASLPALSDAPDWGYLYAYQLPTDCLRVVQVGDVWQIPGVSDFMSGPDSELYRIEGRKIVTDESSPIKIRYVKRVTNAGEFDAAFSETLAADLAVQACEALTQSTTKKESLKNDLMMAVRNSVRANAIELPPQEVPDDSWLWSRL